MLSNYRIHVFKSIMNNSIENVKPFKYRNLEKNEYMKKYIIEENQYCLI